MGELILDRRYSPNYETYRGTAYYGRVDFVTLRTGLPPIDEFLTWIAVDVVEFNVSAQKGRMLQLKIWRNDAMWGFIPTYDWKLEFWFYFPTEARLEALAIPAVVWTILKLILLAIISVAIAAAIWGAVEIFWLPPEERKEIYETLSWAIFLGAFGFGVTPIIIELLRSR